MMMVLKPKPNEEKILHYMNAQATDSWISAKDIRESLVLDQGNCSKYLKNLVKFKYLDKSKEGRSTVFRLDKQMYVDTFDIHTYILDNNTTYIHANGKEKTEESATNNEMEKSKEELKTTYIHEKNLHTYIHTKNEKQEEGFGGINEDTNDFPEDNNNKKQEDSFDIPTYTEFMEFVDQNRGRNQIFRFIYKRCEFLRTKPMRSDVMKVLEALRDMKKIKHEENNQNKE